MQRRRGRMLAQGLGLVAAFGVLIALPQTAADGVRSGLTLCGQVILPSLFPFFVCSNLFVLLGFSPGWLRGCCGCRRTRGARL